MGGVEVEEGQERERGRLANFYRSRQRSLLPIPTPCDSPLRPALLEPWDPCPMTLPSLCYPVPFLDPTHVELQGSVQSSPSP